MTSLSLVRVVKGGAGVSIFRLNVPVWLPRLRSHFVAVGWFRRTLGGCSGSQDGEAKIAHEHDAIVAWMGEAVVSTCVAVQIVSWRCGKCWNAYFRQNWFPSRKAVRVVLDLCSVHPEPSWTYQYDLSPGHVLTLFEYWFKPGLNGSNYRLRSTPLNTHPKKTICIWPHQDITCCLDRRKPQLYRGGSTCHLSVDCFFHLEIGSIW
jgi:hypothetical protein